METTLKRVIKYGSRGDDVSQVQHYLNKALTTKPHLVTDGIFGTKSAARTQQFQRDNQLVADGIVGQKTWAQLIALVKNLLGVPPVDKDKHGEQRKRILHEAGKLIGKVDFTQLIGGRPKGIDIVKAIFKEAANVTLQDNNFKDPHSKAWSTQPFINGKKKSWCGVFCVYCYRKAGLKTISWDLTLGRTKGQYRIEQLESPVRTKHQTG